jgi:hypothetical protein
MTATLIQAPASNDLLGLLYHDQREVPGWLAISVPGSNGGMETVWTQDLDQAARWTAKLSPKANAYVGLGLRRTKGSRTQRGTAADVIAIPGPWADLDVAGGTHSENGKHYFPTKADTRTFLEALPHPPSVIVDSGHGLHAYWLFRELWVFEDDAERLDAAALVEGWQRFLQRRAKEQGIDIDSTFDLARVLRVAPSINHKSSPPFPVTVILADGPEYNPSDFAEYAVSVGAESPAASATFVIKWDAEPPAAFAALLANDTRTRATWDRRRSDLKDQTASAYCMALADAAVATGWSDQDIVDLLVAARRHYGADRKYADWYARTIAKARASTFGTSAPVTDHPEGCHCSGCVEARQSPIERLSAKLGLSVARIIKRGRTGGTYELMLVGGGSVIFGDAGALLSFRVCRAAVLDGTAQVLPAGLGKFWPDVAALIARAAEVVELPSENEEVIGWLTTYVVERNPGLQFKTLERFLEGEGSSGLSESQRVLVIEEGGRTCYYFSLRPLMKSVNLGERVPVTAKSFGARLSRVGCTPKQLSQRVAGSPSPLKRRVWRWCPSEHGDA